MIGLPSGPAFAESFRIDNVDRAARINMRQTPSNKSKIVAYVPPDAVLTGTGKCDAKWCEVTYKGIHGWVFRKYLTAEASGAVRQPDNQTNTVASLPKPPEADSGIPAELQDTMLPLVFSGRPVPVYAFPGDRLPASDHLPLDVKEVEDLGTCTAKYCYIRHGTIVGWISEAAIARGGAPVPASLPPQAKDDPGTVPPRALNNTVPTATQAETQTGALGEGPGSIEIKTYTLAGLSSDASLPVREHPEDNAAILGWIPGDASSVEGMRKCVLKWCLVRYQALTGWVARRYLADETVAANRRFQVDGVALWGALDVMDYPGPGANIIGHIPSYATGLVPIGNCDANWCHIRYLGLAGWVSAKYISAQAH
jgi:SH3-like domain-containing protein